MNNVTTLEQSRQLTQILSTSTADMTYARIAIVGDNLKVPEEIQYVLAPMPFDLYKGVGLPAWSLSALLELFPNFVLSKRENNGEPLYRVRVAGYKDNDIWSSVTNLKKTPIDACVEMIKKLKEENLI